MLRGALRCHSVFVFVLEGTGLGCTWLCPRTRGVEQGKEIGDEGVSESRHASVARRSAAVPVLVPALDSRNEKKEDISLWRLAIIQ